MLKPIFPQGFSPLLATPIHTDEEDKLIFPLSASLKEDGFRAISQPTGFYSRQLLRIPNRQVNEFCSSYIPYGLDGELMMWTGATLNVDPADESNEIYYQQPAKFNHLSSWLNTEYAYAPAWSFVVFDCINHPTWSYIDRLKEATDLVASVESPHIYITPHRLCSDWSDVQEMLKFALAMEREGLILRKLDGHYKFGRSTFNQHIMLKLKPMEDADGTVIGYTQFKSNLNEPTLSATGSIKRSHHQANMVERELLGALIVQPDDTRLQAFNLGTGFTLKQRETLWMERHLLDGRRVQYQYQRHGSLDRPRIGSFRRFLS